MATAMVDSGLPVYKLIFNAGTELHGATTPYLCKLHFDHISSVLLNIVILGSATIPGDNIAAGASHGANITLGMGSK